MTDTMRDDISAALDEIDENYDETPQEVESYDDSEADINTEEHGKEPSASESTEANSATPRADTDSSSSEGDASVKPDEPVQAENASVDTRNLKAPIDWGPKEREDWSKIPRNLQEKIASREQETQQLMQSTADARRTHADFGGLVQQYGSVLSGVAGDTPMQAVESLFSTVANLRMGSPMQKAQVIAGLVSDFGVDISALDSTLSGQMPEQGPNSEMEQRLEQMLEQRMAPFTQYEQQMQMQQQQKTQHLQTQATNEVKGFVESGKAEFLADVRLDMADMIDLANKRGVDLSMQQAYDKACALHPQISQILGQRTRQQQITGGNNSIASKRNAASSITGGRGGSGGGNATLSLRDTLAAAYDQAGE